MKDRALFASALALDLIGAAGALLIATREWQTIRTPHTAPFHTDVLAVSGRTVDSAPTAFALVALAGVVAVLATRGWVRRVVGAVLLLAGVGLTWRAVSSAGAISTRHARTLVADRHRTVVLGSSPPHIATMSIWPWLTVGCAVFVFAAGVLVVWRGHRWVSLSSRHERASTEGSDADIDDEATRTRAATALWTALDRGDDPTG